MLSPIQIQAISSISELLYSFLPGKAHPYANQDISFPGAAKSVGLDKYWMGGSKLPAITLLLSKTYELEKGKFCDLITAIINYGIIYRAKKNPVSKKEIDELNDLILKLSFKIPQLWDKDFLNNLHGSSQTIDDKVHLKKVNYDSLMNEFLKVKDVDDSQKRGFAFEKFLNMLFDEFELNPRKSFKLVGEQIDGSLELDKEIYLIEAKWQKKPIGQSELLAFNGKIEGKSKWTRGIVISHSGISKDGLESFSRGRSTNLITIDGADLFP